MIVDMQLFRISSNSGCILCTSTEFDDGDKSRFPHADVAQRVRRISAPGWIRPKGRGQHSSAQHRQILPFLLPSFPPSPMEVSFLSLLPFFSPSLFLSLLHLLPSLVPPNGTALINNSHNNNKNSITNHANQQTIEQKLQRQERQRH